jgi:hypothetical protein
LIYIAKANDDLKLVTHFEIDSRWGDNSYTVGRNAGGAIGADQINLETKNVYLDFNIPGAPVNVKGGIMGLTDAYKGLFVGNDAAGIVTSAKLGAATLTGGWYRFNDQGASGTQLVGKLTRDLSILDVAVAPTKDLKVGGSYYYYRDDNTGEANGAAPTEKYAGLGYNAGIHVLGVNAAATAGPATIDGFFVYETGSIRPAPGATKLHLNGYAAYLGTKVQAGVGALKANFLYTSGSNVGTSTSGGVGRDSFVTVANETSNAWMESGVFGGANTCILYRGNSYRTSNSDQSIVADGGNKGRGLMAAFLGYDGAVGKTFFNANAAIAASSKKQYGAASKSQYLGTEVNGEVGYKVYDNLKASVQGAYVFLGPAYEGTTGSSPGQYANNPYLARIILSYAF